MGAVDPDRAMDQFQLIDERRKDFLLRSTHSMKSYPMAMHRLTASLKAVTMLWRYSSDASFGSGYSGENAIGEGPYTLSGHPPWAPVLATLFFSPGASLSC